MGGNVFVLRRHGPATHSSPFSSEIISPGQRAISCFAQSYTHPLLTPSHHPGTVATTAKFKKKKKGSQMEDVSRVMVKYTEVWWIFLFFFIFSPWRHTATSPPLFLSPFPRRDWGVRTYRRCSASATNKFLLAPGFFVSWKSVDLQFPLHKAGFKEWSTRTIPFPQNNINRLPAPHSL